MRTQRGNSYNPRTGYYDYSINGKYYWVQGELYYNKKKKSFEHKHIGDRGGVTLIFWTENEKEN